MYDIPSLQKYLESRTGTSALMSSALRFGRPVEHYAYSGAGMRTMILLIYCNIIYSQYNILQYSCVTIQYIAIFLNTNTIYCNIPQEGPATHLSLVFIACRRYETKHDFAGPPSDNATIQYIAIFVSFNTIYYVVLYCHDEPIQYIVRSILQLIYIHRRTSYTTRYAYLHVSGSITRRTIYCTTSVPFHLSTLTF
jgi:hypothetical protein